MSYKKLLRLSWLYMLVKKLRLGSESQFLVPVVCLYIIISMIIREEPARSNILLSYLQGVLVKTGTTPPCIPHCISVLTSVRNHPASFGKC